MLEQEVNISGPQFPQGQMVIRILFLYLKGLEQQSKKLVDIKTL